MALNAADVRAGQTGEVFVGPTTADAPTDATTVLDTDFKGLGYLSSNGVDVEFETSSTDLTAWQNAQVVRTFTTEAKIVYSFTMIETNETTIEFAFGTTLNRTANHGTYTIQPGRSGGRKSFVFQYQDGTDTHREYVAQGELTSMNPSAWQNGEPVAYECEVTAYTSPVVFDTSLRTV